MIYFYLFFHKKAVFSPNGLHGIIKLNITQPNLLLKACCGGYSWETQIYSGPY